MASAGYSFEDVDVNHVLALNALALLDSNNRRARSVKKVSRWLEAQKGEKCLWDGLLHSDYHILQATSDNASKAPGVMGSLGGTPEKSLEVGIGPFGLGISAFLPEISFSFGP